MVFNADKCKVLHFGHNNVQVHYVMDGNILESVEEERDLGVIIQRIISQWISSVQHQLKLLTVYWA